jgi:peptide deformylase
MAVRALVNFPDGRLRLPAVPVENFDAALADLVADLVDTMRAAQGIGITAPHIGVLERVVVIDLPASAGARSYINPEIVWQSPETSRQPEGSVSMPGVSDEVERPAKVRVRYRDLAGDERTEEADGLLALCLQHEIDQLDGIFWIYRLSRLRRDRLIKRFEKLRREGVSQG